MEKEGEGAGKEGGSREGKDGAKGRQGGSKGHEGRAGGARQGRQRDRSNAREFEQPQDPAPLPAWSCSGETGPPSVC